MPNICYKSQYAKNQVGMVLKSPQLTFYLKLIAEIFEYVLKSADRPKPTAVFHINWSRQKYSLATSVLWDSYGPPAETHVKWIKNLERNSKLVTNILMPLTIVSNQCHWNIGHNDQCYMYPIIKHNGQSHSNKGQNGQCHCVLYLNNFDHFYHADFTMMFQV